MRIPQELYFAKDFSIELKVEKEFVLNRLNSFLKGNRNTFGKVRYNEFAFMHRNITPKMNKYSLVVFSGIASSDNNKTFLNIKARLSAPFYYIYIINALLIPLLFIFNTGGIYDEFSKVQVPLFSLFPFLIPIFIYFMLLSYYIMKIHNVKMVLTRFKNKIESEAKLKSSFFK